MLSRALTVLVRYSVPIQLAVMALRSGESVDGVKSVQSPAETVRELADGAERLLLRWS